MGGKDPAEQGFTLLEMLLAVAVFALVVAVTYGALGVAGDGFIQLKQARRALEVQHWLGRQLRMDSVYATSSTIKDIKPLEISSDSRGDGAYDTLDLLVREAGKPDLTRVHYAIDEDSGQLVRQTLSLLAPEETKPIKWQMGKVKAFDVAVMDGQGQWQDRWEPPKGAFKWPRALRVRVVDAGGEREWVLPLFVEQGLR